MPLKPSQIEQCKEKLIELRKQISQTVQGMTKEVTEPGDSKGYSQHQADEGTDDFVKRISLEVSNKELHMIWQIDRALEKIEEGTYGICDLSGEEIPFKRLEAIPYATMTVKAQEQFEKSQKR